MIKKLLVKNIIDSDNRIKDGETIGEIMLMFIQLAKVMKSDILQNTKKGASAIYNYNALATNTIMNYVIFKTGDDFQKLLE